MTTYLNILISRQRLTNSSRYQNRYYTIVVLQYTHDARQHSPFLYFQNVSRCNVHRRFRQWLKHQAISADMRVGRKRDLPNNQNEHNGPPTYLERWMGRNESDTRKAKGDERRCKEQSVSDLEPSKTSHYFKKGVETKRHSRHPMHNYIYDFVRCVLCVGSVCC